MKLIWICTEMLPSPAIKGGAIQIMIDGVLPFISKKFDMTVVSIRDPQLPRQEIKNGIRYVRFPSATYRQHVANWLANQSSALVHVFNRPQNASQYKRTAPQHRYVVSLHNEMFHLTKMNDAQGRLAIRSVKRILTVSDFMGRTVTSRFPHAKPIVETCYSGVDLSTYAPVWTERAQSERQMFRKKMGWSNQKIILFVGRLTIKKGPHLLIKAMPEILKTYPDAKLVIAGGKWFSDNTRNAYVRSLYELAKPYGDRVYFAQYVPSNEVRTYFLAADVFVCSSQWQEPLARVHYEAMAAGTPIITTARGGNPEVIRHGVDGVVLQNYSSVRAFSESIIDTLAHPIRARKRAKSAFINVKNKFSFKHVCARLEAAYARALR